MMIGLIGLLIIMSRDKILEIAMIGLKSQIWILIQHNVLERAIELW